MIRLHKVLAQAGVGSRRACEEYIQEGRIQVDGKVIREVGFQLDPLHHEIVANGEKIEKEEWVYYLLNKPKGVLCTNDPKDPRPRVTEMISERRRLFPVGRLDADTEGLILLTNNGALANKLAHPRYETPKTYFVKVRGKLTGATLEKIREGIWLDFGKATLPKVRLEKKGNKFSSITLTLREGKNRMIRRVFAKVEHPVVTIRRIRLGPLSLKGLPTGRYRCLKKKEIEDLLDYLENPPRPFVRKSSKNLKKNHPFLPLLP
jgi:23S rRNA pseudouridine2605 synthase